MGDISRYKGGARRKQVAGSRQTPRTEERVRDTRAANPVNAPEQNQNAAAEPRRRALNLDTGSFQEEIPISNPDRSRPRPRLGTRVGNTDVELDDDRVRLTRRFSKGGQVGGDIKPPRGPMITYGENGRPIKTTGEQLTRRGGKSRRS